MEPLASGFLANKKKLASVFYWFCIQSSMPSSVFSMTFFLNKLYICLWTLFEESPENNIFLSIFCQRKKKTLMLTRIDTVQMFLFLFAIFLSEKNKNKEILLLCHIAKTKKDPTKPWKKFFQDAKLFFCGKAPIVSLLTISSTFNPLFKVLFIFPSRYLFAIGLSPVFSFRWNLPPF